MNWFRRLRVITRKDATARELDEELQFHIEHQVEEYIASGMSRAEARYAALRDFGALEPLKEQCRSARGLDWLEHLRQDLHYARRSFLRKPSFGLAVIALTATGIGATTAVFSVVDRVLFRALPYQDADSLVSAGLRIPWLEYDFLTAHTYSQLRSDPGPFRTVTSWSGVDDCDVTGDNPVRLACAHVESTFLPVLGVEPAFGRNFSREEDQPGVPHVALISYSLWKSRFGGQPVVGRRLTLDGQPATVVGVLPPDFETPTLERADVLLPQALPLNLAPTAQPIRVYGRLRAGVSPRQARDSLLARAEQPFADVPPHMRKQTEFHVRSIRDAQTGDFRLASWTLLVAVLAMLLIACANAANLLLARSVARRGELAIRAALGAGRSRMIRQILTETLTLSVTGGIAGCGLAYVLLRIFVRIAPKGIPRLATASIDLRVLMFGVAASLASGIIFGILPALYTPKAGMLTGVRTTGPASLVARRLLVGAQIAISLTLLSCAGILLQSLWNRQTVSLGMRTGHIVTARVVLGARYAQAATRREFYENLEARLRRLPGVESVALSDSLPPGGVPRSQPIFALRVDGKPALDEGTQGIVVWRAVTPDYFRTLGISILRGRGFLEEDRTPEARAIILSNSFARRMFGRENAIGRRIARFPGSPQRPAPWYTIVGVAADVRNAGLTDRNDAEYYLVRRHGAASAYEDAPAASAVIVRGSARSSAIQGWLRTEIASLDPALPAVILPFEEHIGELAARPRFQAWLLAMFAGIGMILAASGLYGLVSFLVAQRERELGVRLTLGATPAMIVRMIVGDALRWTAGGLVVGIAAAVAAAYSLRSLLFHVSPANPLAYFSAAALLAFIALAAAWVPSRRAARLDPAATLRHE